MSIKFWRRFRLYMIGVLLGFAMVFVIFKERTALLTAWLPENAVKEAIFSSDWQLNGQDSCVFSCFDADNQGKLLVEEADVLFSESREAESDLRTYIFKHEKVKSFQVVFENDSLISFQGWKLAEGVSCPCF